MQRRAVGWCQTDEKLGELGLTSLEERRHQADMLQVFKILTGKDNVRIKSWLKIAASGVVRTIEAALR